MATSIIKQKYHYVDKVFKVGTSLFQGYYFADDATYRKEDVLSATVVDSTVGNSPAWVYVMSWTTRVLSATANNSVTVRFLLKD